MAKNKKTQLHPNVPACILDRGVDATIAFAENLKDLLHGPFDIERIIEPSVR
jgi:hypothetical protein